MPELPTACWISWETRSAGSKSASQLFTAEGPALVQKLKSRGYKVFLDLKFHDIPNTVHGAVRSAVNLGVEMTTMHFSGGAQMIAAAHKAGRGSSLLILGITVLTSFDEAELAGIGLHDPWKNRSAAWLTWA